MRICAAIILFFITYSGHTQHDSTHSTSGFRRYIDFLKHDDLSQTSLLIPKYNFRYSSCDRIMHAGRGTYLSLGLNLARLFSKKFVLGLTYELKVVRGFWPDNFTNEYRNDFNTYYNNTLTGTDSAQAEAVRLIVNKNTRYSVRGSFYGSYGIMFSPFPLKYGGFTFSVKKCGFGIPVNGSYGTAYNPNGPDWVNINVLSKYEFMLTCKPVCFFKKVYADQLGALFELGVFYTRLNWKDVDYYGLRFDRFMDPAFMNKYAGTTHIGFVMSFNLAPLVNSY